MCGTAIHPARPSSPPRCVLAGPPRSANTHTVTIFYIMPASNPLMFGVDKPPAGAEFWSQALAPCGQFPAASLDTVFAALLHCDWSHSPLLCC